MHRAPIGIEGFRVASKQTERISQIMIRAGIILVHLERLFKGSNRLMGTPQAKKRNPSAAPEAGILGIKRQRALERGERVSKALLLEQCLPLSNSLRNLLCVHR